MYAAATGRAFPGTRPARAAVALAVLAAACASGGRSGAAAAPGDAGAAASLSGPWLVTLDQGGGNQFAVRMTFEPGAAGRWEAFSRPGAAGELVGGVRGILARLLGKLPPRGALVRIENGTAVGRGDTVVVRGKLASPLLGEHYLAGTVVGGRLRGELRRDTLGAPAGTLEAVPHAGGRPVRDYRALAAGIRRTVEERIFNPALLERPEWRAFFRRLDARLAAAQDDADAVAAFYALKPGVRISHFELFRNPARAALPADSLLLLATAPAEGQVVLSFPAPGVAHLRILRFHQVRAAVERAFARVDSAAPHTLILDVRGNPGGDASAIAAAAHLLRDTTVVGAFLGQKWYRSHQAPPTRAELAALPVISDDRGIGLILAVREHGVAVGVMPPAAPHYGGPVYLLVDRRSGSASEPLAHLLRSTGRATLVGENTAGAMLTGPPFPVGDGWILVVPEADYYAADGTRLEGTGVAPHVAVPSADALGAVGERIRGEHPYAGALLRAAAGVETRRWSEAERWYLEARRLEPDSAAPAHGLGRAYQEQAKWEEAFAVYEGLLARNPGEVGALYQVGRTAALSGRRLERGEQALRAYLQRPHRPGQPSLAGAHWRLGMILERRGERDQARREYETASRLEPQNAEIRASLRALGP
ncbi:MAG TPA: S41 family peptidase [Longimicrobium sp.]|jgi:hypothetical protein